MYEPVTVTLMETDPNRIEFPTTPDDAWLVVDDAGTRYFFTESFFTNLSNPDADEIKPGDRIKVERWTLIPVESDPQEN